MNERERERERERGGVRVQWYPVCLCGGCGVEGVRVHAHTGGHRTPPHHAGRTARVHPTQHVQHSVPHIHPAGAWGRERGGEGEGRKGERMRR